MATADYQSGIESFVDAHREEAVGFLAELVKVPSDNPPGDCVAHAARAAELLEQMGFEVERHPVPEAVVRAAGMVAVTNLVVRRRFGPGPVVALNAHGDVVPPGTGWTQDPYGAAIVDGWMYGRGVAVSKSDFATYAFAMRALVETAAPKRGTVELHLTYDEEAGGEIGPKWLLDQGISRPDLAIAAGFSYAVVTAHNGCLHLEVEVTGRSAHAAKPSTGIDALEAATAVLRALYAERRGYAGQVSAIEGIGAPQLTVGLIKGGINTNVVPDKVTLRLDRRLIPEEDPAVVEARLREVVTGAAGRGRGRPGRGPADPAGPAAGADRRPRAPRRPAHAPCQPHHGRAGPDDGRAALHGCPSLRRGGHPDRALRRRPAHDRGGQRPSRRRAPAAGRSDASNQGGGAGALRCAGGRERLLADEAACRAPRRRAAPAAVPTYMPIPLLIRPALSVL